MSEDSIEYNKKGKVALMTLSRPPANAYNLAFYQRFHTLVAQADADCEVGVVIIDSGSETFFCAGADIKEFEANSTADKQKMVEEARRTLAAMEASTTLFIAQISGHALGGGLEIAMACDLRFAARGTYKLGLPEIKLGLIPGNGGTQRLLRLVGMSRAMELLAAGDTFSVEDAFHWGLVQKLYEPNEIARATLSYATAVAGGPLLAVAAIKKALRQGVELSLSDGLALEKKLCDPLYDTHDGQEGFKAFIEKRSPEFRGK